MSAIVIIPSRYQSTRFPGKPLSLLLGKPMIQHVYERSKAARLIKEVFVATDNKAICDAVRGFGGKAVMT
jgi:CMP-2-keto-3-deoxyoctulosonic acid synthetase